MSKFYDIEIAGHKRRLERFPVSDSLDIAAFILFGDVEITVASAAALIHRLPSFDVIFTPEAKSIPLAYEMSRQTGKPYVVGRKGLKVYMRDPVEVTVNSITTQKEQHIYIGIKEAEILKGKRVVIIDDVISTGESIKACEELVEKAGGLIAAKAAVLAEGDASERDDIIYLEKLPLFFK